MKIENSDFLRTALFFDLETAQTGKIYKIGAILGDKVFFLDGNFNAVKGFEALDNFAAASAQCVVGHNIVGHDLKCLSANLSQSQLLRLPAIDTLLLSPLCFPANPYHDLVKDYKLTPAAMNDPVSDSRQAKKLLEDEITTLQQLASNSPEIFKILRSLICDGGSPTPLSKGMRLLFNKISPLTLPPEALLKELKAVLCRFACKTKANALSEAEIASETSRWLMAYALRLVSISRTDSVLPPWVRLHHREISSLLSELRDKPCADPGCAYCKEIHDPEVQLNRFFGFDKFRSEPKHTNGNSLQLEIVKAGMRGESLLAIMPTGGGKSLGFQLPALVRNARRGYLTIVVSPLQALMKDQVDNLQRQGLNNCAALCGILTLPERADVLRNIRSGTIALLYLSPEQLRSKAVHKALLSR